MILAGAVAAGLCGSVFVVGLAVVGGSVGAGTSGAAAALTLQPACQVSGPVPTLTADQASNAEAIVAATFAAAGESRHAAQIAVMTAITESSLNNDNFGDRDSLGLFQQRASQGWGTRAQELDPTAATDMFVARLLEVPGWATLDPGIAAQDVQRSAFPDRYDTHWAAAGVYLAAVVHNGTVEGGCGQGIPNGVTGNNHGLPAGYSIPAGTRPGHAAAVSFALAQLGKPYVWAAAGPATFDCSGLTMAAWATAGIRLAHYTVTQQNEGAPVDPSALQPGDLVLTPGSDSPGPGLAGHVGIYLGDGLVLSAIDPQDGIAVQTYQLFVSGGLDALRDPMPSDG